MANTENSELIWKENREIILFGILASLIVLFAGIISGIAYLIIISALVFLGFAFLLGWSVYLCLLETARKNSYKIGYFERGPEQQGLEKPQFPELISLPAMRVAPLGQGLPPAFAPTFRSASWRMAGRDIFGQTGTGVTGESGEERLKEKVNELNFLLNSTKNKTEEIEARE